MPISKTIKMSNFSRLTPFSRAMIASAIAGCLFLLIKNFVLPKSDDVSSTQTTGKKSNAPVLLSLSGSSTLGANMVPQIAKQFMSLELNAQNVTIQKVNDNEINVVGSIDGTEKRIAITTQGSTQGIEDARNQKADLAMVSGGVDNLSADMRLANIALDGIAILANKANKVKELTKNQVRDIFTGKISNWSQVGGQDGLIKTYTRSSKSGTYEAFKQLILEQASTLAIGVTVFDDSKPLVAAIESDANGIGFSSFSSIGATNALGLSDVGTMALYPSVFTIQTEDYLLTRRLYLVHLFSNSNPLTQRFIDFCAADDKGQKTVAETGFVNMNLHNEGTHTISANAPPEYLAATTGASRLPTTLHFQSGSSAPDVRATDDIKRIIAILAEPQNRQKQVVLIGFTDNIGNPTQNLTLSTQRAESIQTEFSKFGLKTQVHGFGQALPVAVNTTALGQNRNRRVEVWCK
jgi:phosphate transport system substrate-binding protein